MGAGDPAQLIPQSPDNDLCVTRAPVNAVFAKKYPNTTIRGICLDAQGGAHGCPIGEKEYRTLCDTPLAACLQTSEIISSCNPYCGEFDSSPPAAFSMRCQPKMYTGQPASLEEVVYRHNGGVFVGNTFVVDTPARGMTVRMDDNDPNRKGAYKLTWVNVGDKDHCAPVDQKRACEAYPW